MLALLTSIWLQQGIRDIVRMFSCCISTFNECELACHSGVKRGRKSKKEFKKNLRFFLFISITPHPIASSAREPELDGLHGRRLVHQLLETLLEVNGDPLAAQLAKREDSIISRLQH